MLDKTAHFIEWLRGLAPHTELLWHSPNIALGEKWLGGWCIIGVETFRPQSITGCGVTFIPPRHRLGAPPSHYVLEQDLDVHAVFNPKTRWFTAEVPLPLGHVPDPQQQAQLAAALAAHPDCQQGIRGGWSVERLTEGIGNWAAVHADRNDLEWVWDHDWQLPASLLDLCEAVKNGTEPTYRLGENLVVSGQAFDAVLGVPGMFSPRRKRADKPPAASQPDPFDM